MGGRFRSFVLVVIKCFEYIYEKRIPSSLEDSEAVSSCLIEVDIRKEKLIIAKRVGIGSLFTFPAAFFMVE